MIIVAGKVSNCCGEGFNGYDLLCLLLQFNRNLTCIYLQNNNIQTNGGTHLPDFLATNPPLGTLRLENNNFNDVDAELIASALKQNTNLKHLYVLGGSQITDVGGSSLHDALFDSSSLNAAAVSNHTCYILGLDPDCGFNNTDTAKVNRGRKIYSILSERNRAKSNVHHLDLEFGDDSVTFVPEVLECVQRYSKLRLGVHVPPLSIMFEMLRSWNMPELYGMR